MNKPKFPAIYKLGIVVLVCIAGIVLALWSNTRSDEGNKVSRDELGFIKKGLSYEEVISQIGKPERDIGSGVHWFEYTLADGDKLLLCFINLDHLERAVVKGVDGVSITIVP